MQVIGGSVDMLGQLIPLGGGDPIPLNKPSLLVGRRPSCDIRLEFANVSSHHCLLEYINGYWRALDMNSSNGTKVNGERIDEKFILPGDKVAFAKHAYEIQYTPDPESAPPVEEEDPFAMSLLEKAGLGNRDRRERRDRRHRRGPRDHSKEASSKHSENGAKKNGKPPTPPVKRPPDDDDKALEWLKD
jgi:adenylate cyclase